MKQNSLFKQGTLGQVALPRVIYSVNDQNKMPMMQPRSHMVGEGL